MSGCGRSDAAREDVPAFMAPTIRKLGLEKRREANSFCGDSVNEVKIALEKVTFTGAVTPDDGQFGLPYNQLLN